MHGSVSLGFILCLVHGQQSSLLYGNDIMFRWDDVTFPLIRDLRLIYFILCGGGFLLCSDPFNVLLSVTFWVEPMDVLSSTLERVCFNWFCRSVEPWFGTRLVLFIFSEPSNYCGSVVRVRSWIRLGILLETSDNWTAAGLVSSFGP